MLSLPRLDHSVAAEAVSWFPGPPLEDPPTSPPRPQDGGLWGERGGTTGALAAPQVGRRSTAKPTARSRAAAALRPTCHQESRRRTTGAAVEPRRALSVRRPGFGRGDDRGGDLDGAAPSEAQRSDLQAGQFAKWASFTRSVKEPGPRSPVREGRRIEIAGAAGLAELREGWQPGRGETPADGRWLDAERNSPAPRSGDTPAPTATRYQARISTIHPFSLA